MHRLNRCLVIALAVSTALSQTPPPSGQNPLAIVGKRSVTELEFLQRFETMLPAGGRSKAALEEQKQVALYSLIAEKLLAAEGARRNLGADSGYQDGLSHIRKLLARDELYRREIVAKVNISPPELQEGIRRALRQLRCEFLFFERGEDARLVRSTMNTRLPLSAAGFDSTINATFDTASVIFGDANEAIENAAYRLKRGGVSPVVEVAGGFYILRVDQESASSYYAGMQPSVLRARVEELLRLRKERKRMDEFVSTALKDKIGYSRPAALREITDRLLEFLAQRDDSAITLQQEDVLPLRRMALTVLSDTFAVAGKTVWSVGDALPILCNGSITIERGESHHQVAAKVSQSARVWVQQELLAQEALSRGLDRVPSVARLVDMWNDSFLSVRMKHLATEGLEVDDLDVWRALAEDDSSAPTPILVLRELTSDSHEFLMAVKANSGEGINLDEAYRRVNERTGGNHPPPIIRSSIPWKRAGIGEIAWRMPAGGWGGPVPDGNQQMLFEVMERRIPPRALLPWSQGHLDTLRAELMKLQRKGRIDRMIAQLASRTEITVFEERLKSLDVTRLPMMTYRILGFGGRMFAAPFVEPQVDWLDVQLPPAATLP